MALRRGFSTTEYGNSYIALGLGFLMGSLLLATVGGEQTASTCIEYFADNHV